MLLAYVTRTPTPRLACVEVAESVPSLSEPYSFPDRRVQATNASTNSIRVLYSVQRIKSPSREWAVSSHRSHWYVVSFTVATY